MGVVFRMLLLLALCIRNLSARDPGFGPVYLAHSVIFTHNLSINRIHE